MTRALPFAVCALLLAGCSGNPGSGADGGAEDAGLSLSPVELCDRLSKAKCELLAHCYPAYVREPVEQCRANQQARCLSAYDALRVSLEEKKVELDVAAVERCEVRMASRTCPPTFPPGYPFAASPFSDCELGRGILKGKVENGKECRSALECQPGYICFKGGADVCLGTCSKAPTEGEPCAFGCAADLYCDGKGTDQDSSDDTCEKLKGAGAACDSSAECDGDHYCAAGRCRARGQLGEGCIFDPLRTSTCRAGLACDVVPYVDGAQGTCIVPVGIGGRCRFHWSCQPGLVCAGIDWTGFPLSTPSQGDCVPPQLTDSACSFTPYSVYVGETCQAGTSCSAAGQCRTLGNRGDVCTPSAPNSCAGTDVYCQPSGGGSSGTCLGPPTLNQRCGVAIDSDRTIRIPCSAGYCEGTTLTCRTGNKQEQEPCQSDAECLSNRCAVLQDQTQRCAKACN